MEKLIVNEEGKITIPSHFLERRGLRPGDELTLIEIAEGLLLYQHGDDPLTSPWWESLNEEEKRRARDEAIAYLNLNEAECDRIWNEGAESIEAEAEGDEVEVLIRN